MIRLLAISLSIFCLLMLSVCVFNLTYLYNKHHSSNYYRCYHKHYHERYSHDRHCYHHRHRYSYVKETKDEIKPGYDYSVLPKKEDYVRITPVQNAKYPWNN